jgi:hypothetical protein
MITLSTKQEVTFKDYIPHKAEVAFWDKVRELAGEGKVTMFIYNRAIEALLPFIISSPDPTPEWIGDLKQEDYLKLEEAARQLRDETDKRIADGEKKDTGH